MKVKLAAAFAVLFLASIAHADSGDPTLVYSYAGNQLLNNSPLFQAPGVPPCTCAIDGWFSVAGSGLQNPVDVLSYSFTTGFLTLNPSNSVADIFNYLDNSSLWGVVITGTGAYAGDDIITNFDNSASEATDAAEVNYALVAYEAGDYGTWSVADPPPVNTPEPTGWAMLALGILAVLALPRGKSYDATDSRR
jgi:hypothetical protein